MKVSVIIPIYRVERFIGRCAESLMRQTLEDVEYIFVNDATPDGSMTVLQNVLDRYPQKSDCAIILNHAQNKGLPAARNTGLNIAQGEYIFHCDGDDFADEKMLEEMYATAKSKDSDIVWCDWFLSYGKKERYMKQPSFPNAMDGLKAMLSGAMKYNVWNKLVRRSLYKENGISFPSMYGMGEDMTMIMLFSCAKKVGYLNKAYYHYVKLNENAFSQTYSDIHLTELRYNVDRLVAYLRGKYGNDLEQEIMSFKLDVKYPFLITDDRNRYRLWQSWFVEANPYIWKNKRVSFRARLIQWMASKKQYWFLSLHYKVMYKLLYRIIYR